MGAVRVAIAGSTGSIGRQTLDVIRAENSRADGDAYEIVALGVGSSVETLIAQALEFRPQVVAVADESRRREVAAALPFARLVDTFSDIVDLADVVVNGVVGFAGLPVTLATLRAGKRLALANKESLIAAGPIVQPLRSTVGAEIVPVDSEHCAIHQCLRASMLPNGGRELASLVLTASGGPFRGRSAEALAEITVEQALAHPTWSMGPKITVDSSTLMNKGLEVIEAHYLFGVDFDDIRIVVHPQSTVHSMVEFADGSVKAHLGVTDMRVPIQYALSHPRRWSAPLPPVDFAALGRLEFEEPDWATFRCLGLALEAGRVGGTAPAALNGANEVAVAAFLDGRLPLTGIDRVVETVMERHDAEVVTSFEQLEDVDRWARARATLAIASA